MTGVIPAAGGVLVVGSLNTDFTVYVDELPRPGQTLCVTEGVTSFGGKGANQAIQARRLGVPVTFVGAVGADDRGRDYLRRLESVGVEPRITRVDDAATGLGFIHCTADGTVSSTVVSGANARLSPAAVDAALAAARRPGLVLTQNEIPAQTVLAVGRRAREMHVPAVLNAAPHVTYGEELHGLFDCFIVNEEEALAYAGYERAPEGLLGWRRLAAGLRRIAPEVIVTLGAAGSVYAGPQGVEAVPAHPVQAVDTTGAGDSFVGTLCAALVRGERREAALRFATIAGALTTVGSGAQESMPGERQVFGEAGT
ncbi:ribokinase [Actinomyces sp.]|uniref:ribokinase n=1 Tax=Actinomyces sp. TaxID=29317 RepID=UPI0026DCD342|nr:ribokinase [Actinomyces sp.]MDO4900314.1 ribokinase [Actinomyces sp.]